MRELRNTLDTGTLDALRESVGGDPEVLAELVDELLDDAPIRLQTLRAAALSGDADAARRAAHTLKSNGWTFGAGELAGLCQEAEAAAGARDLNALLSRIDEIDKAWGRVRAELLALRDGRG